MKEWNEYTYFERISGSTIYPSDDSNDSSYDKFKCKLCGYIFEEQMCGSFPIGHDSEKEAKKKMNDHLVRYHLSEVYK